MNRIIQVCHVISYTLDFDLTDGSLEATLPGILCILSRRRGQHVTPIRVIVNVGLREVLESF